jgi:hypothetical protein
MTTTRKNNPTRKAAPARKAAAAPMTTTAQIDAALARLAQHPGMTQHFHIDLAGTTLNAVRVRILRTPRRLGLAANRIQLVATEGTVVTLAVTNTGEAAAALPASAGGPAPKAKTTKAKAAKTTKAARRTK